MDFKNPKSEDDKRRAPRVLSETTGLSYTESARIPVLPDNRASVEMGVGVRVPGHRHKHSINQRFKKLPYAIHLQIYV